MDATPLNCHKVFGIPVSNFPHFTITSRTCLFVFSVVGQGIHGSDCLIDHFTVLYLVTWRMHESEAGVDLALIETSLLFLCKYLLISLTTTLLTQEKGEVYRWFSLT